MPTIIMTKLKSKAQVNDGQVRSKTLAFLGKLAEDDTAAGLHIEPMQNAVDPRARTGRVDKFWRAVLYRLDHDNETSYVYAGTFAHDEAIRIAKTQVLRVNPINGVAELIEQTAPVSVDTSAPQAVSSVVPEVAEPAAPSPVEEPVAEAPADEVEVAPKVDEEPLQPPASGKVEAAPAQAVEPKTPPRPKPRMPFLAVKGYRLDELTATLGFDPATARMLWSFTTQKALLGYAEELTNEWQINAVICLTDGLPLVEILREIGAPETVTKKAAEQVVSAADTGVDNQPVSVQPAPDQLEVAAPSVQTADDAELIEALSAPGSQSQFAFIENDDELRRILEGGDFGAWRVFLHPEQRRYVTMNTSGPYRITGGAGTGKTVVLLHRARRLMRSNPKARIVLTTFTKALAGRLEGDLKRLDPDIRIAKKLGDPGVLVRGIDQLTAAVRKRYSNEFVGVGMQVLGRQIKERGGVYGTDTGLEDVLAEFGGSLTGALAKTDFYVGEVMQVVLPQHIVSKEQYFTARRPGRAVSLDRERRAQVWDVIERHRAEARVRSSMTFAEVAACAAEVLNEIAANGEGRLADHVLVDEAQDFNPLHWQFLRALVDEDVNDLFIAEDAHQRIYGLRFALKPYGIRIQGRSRRLTLNYRTTQENLDFALQVLAGGEYNPDDVDLGAHETYRSARSGPRPRLEKCNSIEGEFDAIAAAIRGWIEQGVAPGTIACLVRSKRVADRLRRALDERGVTAENVEPGIDDYKNPVVLTMHNAKGLEFSRVVLPRMSAKDFPPDWAFADVASDEVEEARLRERSLLYVAASRARDELMVTWTGNSSEYLEEALTEEASEGREEGPAVSAAPAAGRAWRPAAPAADPTPVSDPAPVSAASSGAIAQETESTKLSQRQAATPVTRPEPKPIKTDSDSSRDRDLAQQAAGTFTSSAPAADAARSLPSSHRQVPGPSPVPLARPTERPRQEGYGVAANILPVTKPAVVPADSTPRQPVFVYDDDEAIGIVALLRSLLRRTEINKANWPLVERIAVELKLEGFHYNGSCIRAKRSDGSDVRMFPGRTVGLTRDEAHRFTEEAVGPQAVAPRAWSSPHRPDLWAVDHPVQPAPTAEELAKKEAAEAAAAQRAGMRRVSSHRTKPTGPMAKVKGGRSRGEAPVVICPDCFMQKSASGECGC